MTTSDEHWDRLQHAIPDDPRLTERRPTPARRRKQSATCFRRERLLEELYFLQCTRKKTAEHRERLATLEHRIFDQ